MDGRLLLFWRGCGEASEGPQGAGDSVESGMAGSRSMDA